LKRGREGGREDLGGGQQVVTEGEEGNEGYSRAGGEQTVQIITLSSGMEVREQGG